MRGDRQAAAVLALSAVNAVVVAAVCVQWVRWNPAFGLAALWEHNRHLVLPAVWLVVAAVCAAGDGGPVRLAVGFAAGCCLALNLPHLQVAANRLAMPAALPQVVGGGWYRWAGEPNTGQLLVVLTALIPAVGGWWQRRKRLLADPD